MGIETLVDRVNRGFTASRPNELWFTDITEHPARDGKVYCCAILDCFSKVIVGRSFSTTADTALVNYAVNMAAQERIRWEATILHDPDRAKPELFDLVRLLRCHDPSEHPESSQFDVTHAARQLLGVGRVVAPVSAGGVVTIGQPFCVSNRRSWS